MGHRHTMLSTDDAVRKYLEARTNANEPISLADAVRTIRIVVPGCEMTDRELGDIVARNAIAKGHNVDFDQRRSQPVRTPVCLPAAPQGRNASASSVSVH